MYSHSQLQLLRSSKFQASAHTMQWWRSSPFSVFISATRCRKKNCSSSLSTRSPTVRRHFRVTVQVGSGRIRVCVTVICDVEMGRVPSEDKEADLCTKYLERDPIKKCVTKMGMLFAGAWAGEQLLVVSATEVVMERT